jgi:hypothetical protein
MKNKSILIASFLISAQTWGMDPQYPDFYMPPLSAFTSDGAASASSLCSLPDRGFHKSHAYEDLTRLCQEGEDGNYSSDRSEIEFFFHIGTGPLDELGSYLPEDLLLEFEKDTTPEEPNYLEEFINPKKLQKLVATFPPDSSDVRNHLKTDTRAAYLAGTYLSTLYQLYLPVRCQKIRNTNQLRDVYQLITFLVTAVPQIPRELSDCQARYTDLTILIKFIDSLTRSNRYSLVTPTQIEELEMKKSTLSDIIVEIAKRKEASEESF